MNRKRPRFWLWAGAALAAGLLLRMWFVRHMPLIAGDSLMYGDIAKNWLQHGVYGFTEIGAKPGTLQIRPTLIRLPGYPLFLAACFRVFGVEHYSAVLYVQTAADLLTCWLASALAGRMFGSRAALAVLWLAALCPFTASYVAAPLTETLVLTTIATALYGFARSQAGGGGYSGWLWVTAAALGCSILLRPEQVLFAAAVLGGMLWASLVRRSGVRRSRALSRMQSARPIFAAAVCVALPLIPWTIRNERTFHVFQPLAPKYANDPGELAPIGFARWYRTWAIDFASTENVYWNYSGDPISVSDLPSRAFDAESPSASQDLRKQTATLIGSYNATTGGTTAVFPVIDARFGALGRERIHEHPFLYYAVLPIARVLNMSLRPRTETMPIALEWWKRTVPRRQAHIAEACAALNLAYILVGVAGFFAWRRRAWTAAGPLESPAGCYRELALAMAASIILRAALLLTIDNSEPRYTLEFFPILFVWAGALFRSAGQSADATEPGGR
jgi:hypothetical protein